MTSRTLLESFGLVLSRENLFDCNRMRRTQYFHHSLKNVICKNSSILLFWLWNLGKLLFGSFEIKKSPPPHDWCDKIRFTRRMTTPIDSADTHGPKQVFKSNFWIPKSFEKFLRGLQVNPSRLLKGIFLCFGSDFRENHWKSCKNRYFRTFRWIKIDWRSFWWHHAPCWKA